MKEGMKISVFTIVLIVLSLWLISEAVTWNNAKKDKWNDCEAISNDKTRLSLESFSLNDNSLNNKIRFSEWHSGADDYGDCLDTYTDVWIWYDISKYLALISIIFTILSWRIDKLKK